MHGLDHNGRGLMLSGMGKLTAERGWGAMNYTSRQDARMLYGLETAEATVDSNIDSAEAHEPANPAAILSAFRRAKPEHSTKLKRWLRLGEVPLGLRLIEIVAGAVGLLLTLPIMAVIAFCIRWDSPGPALFRQERVGKGGEVFSFIKFRTMYIDAKKRWPGLYAYSYTPQQLDALKFKVVSDPRVTPVGRWLRQTSLDELPNFWNVLTGDIALVGPRPEIPEMLKYYKGEQFLKFSVRPGVTGLAQVSGRGRLSFQDTIKLDLDYVKNRSFAHDCKLIMKTIKMVLTGDGAF